MTDKKPQPGDAPQTWEETAADDDHTRSYYVKDGSADPESPAEPETPVAVPAEPAPASEAVRDIKNAGLTPEEAVAASKAIAAEAEDKKARAEARKSDSSGRRGAETLVAVARFRWTLLLVLSLVSVAAWAGESEYSARPYHWVAWGLLVISLILTLPTAKFLRLPTRGGLAALCWSATFFISALSGPSEVTFRTVPMALPWAGLLTMVMIWVGVAIWRKLGRYKVIDIVLSVILIYAATSPLWCLVDNITGAQALNINFQTLSTCPELLTSRFPWYFWPMTVTVAIILPLAAIFALWDQFSAFRRRGGRHGGNFFLALAFALLIPYAFLTYAKAVEVHPQWAENIRGFIPGLTKMVSYGEGESEKYTLENRSAASELTQPAEPAAPAPEPPPTAAPAPTEPAPAPTEPAPLLTAPPATEPAAPVPTEEPAPSPSLSAPSAPALPPAVVPAPAEPTPTLEDKLRTAEDQLKAAQARIEELEGQLRELQPAPESAGPRPEGIPSFDLFDADEPAADPPTGGI